ncbi:MAG: ankyrin repeat domain-containing protein [Candidatus Babeliales bacterium]
MEEHIAPEPNFCDIALMEYITQQDRANVRAVLQCPVHINLAHPHYNGHTPLAEAVATDNASIVDLLLAHPEIDLDADAGQGYRALHIATMQGQDSMVRKLCAAGASLETLNEDGDTPLHIGFRYRKPKTVRMLISTVATKKIAAAAKGIEKLIIPFLRCCKRHTQEEPRGVLGMLPRDIRLMLCGYYERAIMAFEAEQLRAGSTAPSGIFIPIIENQLVRVTSALAMKNEHDWVPEQLLWHNDSETPLLLNAADKACMRNAIMQYVQIKYQEVSLESRLHNSRRLQSPPIVNTVEEVTQPAKM